MGVYLAGMNDHHHAIDRSTLIAGGTLLTAALAMPATARPVPLGDFSFQDGKWKVHHRKLRKRLAASNEWYEFTGSTRAGPLMGGLAGYEDNFLDDPTGPYRAEGLRRLDPKTGLWSIWWWDERFSEIEPPVTGRFENGVGAFFGDSMWDEKPIRVRYIWDMPSPDAPRWQQAFSPDQGISWETNWIMEFRR
jgi:hypothetical protein